MSEKDFRLDRRDFLKVTSGTAAGFMIVKPESVRGSRANSAVQLGIIGCGGRGLAVGASMVENTGTQVVALADLFADRLEAAGRRFHQLSGKLGIPPVSSSQHFLGPESYLRLLESPAVDAVLIASPPYFHPQHLEAAVEAGKHVYCEKPVAVDVYGCKRVMHIGEKAQGKLSLDVGFQIRNAPPFVEMVKRIHAGALGRIVCGQAYYYTGALNLPSYPNASPAEAQIRYWQYYRELSGDILVEQNIHIVDICNWVLRSHPLKASASGGRKTRTDSGNVWDHYAATLHYPNHVPVSFSSTQFQKGWNEVCERFFGTKGVSESHYSYPVAIYGEEPWDAGLGPGAAMSPEKFKQSVKSGMFPGALEHADSEKQKAFIKSITSKQFHNQADQGAESALSAILARTAAYVGEEVTWDELVTSDARWDPMIDLEDLAGA